jgi:hypothetical protein
VIGPVEIGNVVGETVGAGMVISRTLSDLVPHFALPTYGSPNNGIHVSLGRYSG